MKIAQISDLHFGAHDEAVGEALMQCLIDAAPDLIIISGDITQSATTDEFRQAEAYFARLPAPWLAIPGNHDLPGMDIVRFINPYGRYKRHISENLNPTHSSSLVHIEGINSSRPIMAHWNWANGSISHQQCRNIAAGFQASTSPWRLCVLHHPLMNSRDFPLEVALFKAEKLLETLQANRVDIVMAGHQHHAYAEPIVGNEHTTLFVNASTAMSTRIRRQPNGFNMLNFSESAVRIDLMRWDGTRFDIFTALTHTKSPQAKPAQDAAPAMIEPAISATAALNASPRASKSVN